MRVKGRPRRDAEAAEAARRVAEAADTAAAAAVARQAARQAARPSMRSLPAELQRGIFRSAGRPAIDVRALGRGYRDNFEAAFPGDVERARFVDGIVRSVPANHRFRVTVTPPAVGPETQTLSPTRFFEWMRTRAWAETQRVPEPRIRLERVGPLGGAAGFRLFVRRGGDGGVDAWLVASPTWGDWRVDVTVYPAKAARISLEGSHDVLSPAQAVLALLLVLQSSGAQFERRGARVRARGQPVDADVLRVLSLVFPDVRADV